MVEKTKAPTKVFISYSWELEAHKDKVLSLANQLRTAWGIEAEIDEYVKARPPHEPRDGWDNWIEGMIEWAEFVLMICTKTYLLRFQGKDEPGEGRGVAWEAKIIRTKLYNKNSDADTKFIPILFSRDDEKYIPEVLGTRSRYFPEDNDSFVNLCYRLRKESVFTVPDVNVGTLAGFPLPSSLAGSPLPIASPLIYRHSQNLQAERPLIRLDDAVLKYAQGFEDSLISASKNEYESMQEALENRKFGDAQGSLYYFMFMRSGQSFKFMMEGSFDCVKLLTFIQNLPCDELRRIDELWVKHSEGKFGFSVQKEIWKELGSPILPESYERSIDDGEFDDDELQGEIIGKWMEIAKKLGWMPKGTGAYDSLSFGLGMFWARHSPKGALPRVAMLFPVSDDDCKLYRLIEDYIERNNYPRGKGNERPLGQTIRITSCLISRLNSCSIQ